MIHRAKKMDPGWGFKILLITVFLNALIAIWTTSIGFGGSFIHNLIQSQCIGLCICSCVMVTYHLTELRPNVIRWLCVSGSVVLGSGVGIVLGEIIMTGELPRKIFVTSFYQMIAVCVILGGIITNFFISKRKVVETRLQMQEETIKRLTGEKKLVESELKRLQAQIEPHFLFNTLSNIISFLDTDTPKAKTMLSDLNQYLRSTLSMSRQETITLGQEAETLTAYLNLFQIRMGDRLTFDIQIPEAYREHPVAPMLLQPLVENSIRHGLEPKVDGGHISIEVQQMNDKFRLMVRDTGRGLDDTGRQGVGLSNITERLKSLYGEQGRLLLEENRPSGLTVIIEIPYVRD
jgi:sensor histidine kinase YesM